MLFRSKEMRFRQVVEETLEWARRELSHPDGAFYAAQDADSEGEEGRFFVWDPAEIQAVLGQELGEAFCRAYGVTDSGNFGGKTVLNRLGDDGSSAEAQEQFDATLRPARKKLLSAREQRVKPQRDENILTSWNALAVSAFLDAYQTFGTPWYLSSAEQALTFLIDYAIAGGRVYRTVAGGSGRIAG